MVEVLLFISFSSGRKFNILVWECSIYIYIYILNNRNLAATLDTSISSSFTLQDNQNFNTIYTYIELFLGDTYIELTKY